MRNLLGKIALTAGSALIVGVLLIVAYIAAGAFILAGFLSAVFADRRAHRRGAIRVRADRGFGRSDFRPRGLGSDRARCRRLVAVEEAQGMTRMPLSGRTATAHDFPSVRSHNVPRGKAQWLQAAVRHR